MNRRIFVFLLAAVAIFAVWNIDVAGSGEAQAIEFYRNTPPLFSNYYVPPVGHPVVGAQLYVSPRPVPPRVGHTYITYQPLMPHEFLYPHHRVYLRHHPGGGCTTTTVSWW